MSAPESEKRGKFGITNDVNWYKHYPQLTGDVAKVFMSRPNGTDYPRVTSGNVPSIHAFTGGESAQYLRQGGFVRLATVPTWGATGTMNIAAQPLNTAASKLYYYVVHGNSRNISYDKSDLMKCCMAYDSVIMMLEEAKRAYKFIKAQSVDNRWVRNIVSGLNWDYDDLSRNVVRFRQVINLAAIKMNQISIPNVFDMFNCHKELFQNVYVDRASGKPQFLALVSCGAWIYDDTFSELEFFTHGDLPGVVPPTVNWSNTARTVSDFERLINYMIDSIYNSTDIGVIQGDLKRAFNEGQMIDIELLNEDNDLPLLPSLEFNLCVHNAEFFPYLQTYTVTDPITSAVRNVYGVVRDTRLMDGNMECGFKKSAADTGNWHPIDGHVMDLIDDWREDEDAIILMQKFKHDMQYNSAFYEHSQASETGNWPAAIPSSVGPAFIMEGYYFYDPTNLNSFITIKNIKDMNTDNDAIDVIKLFECAVTFLMYTRFTDPNTNTTYAGPITWEVENVVNYSRSVLYQIQNSMIESLWYNPALYNLG